MPGVSNLSTHRRPAASRKLTPARGFKAPLVVAADAHEVHGDARQWRVAAVVFLVAAFVVRLTFS